MFTGIVEAVGRVARVRSEAAGVVRCWVELPAAWKDAGLGESIAVNGCCLTVAALESGAAAFDLLQETRRATNLGRLQPGDCVNLERALRADARLGGHFVTGHVDTVGTIEAFEPQDADWRLVVQAPGELLRWVVAKGSIAIDGISLTVAEVDARAITVWIIPHTRKHTTLARRRAGDRVNVEFDLLAKHVEKLLAAAQGAGQ